jgi:hypothetical protein
MHFLMKWEMRQLPLQMLQVLGTSEADCNNMLHKAEEAMVVESPSTVCRHQPANRGQGKMWPIVLAQLRGSLADMLHVMRALQNISQKEKEIVSSGENKVLCF